MDSISDATDFPGHLVPPGKSVEFSCLFDLKIANGYAEDVLGDLVTFTWNFQLQDRTEEFQIIMERENP